MGIVRGDVAGATASGQNFTQFEDATVIDARAGDIVVDDVVLLTQGQYLRLGPDLMIVGPDGQKVLLADYFAVQTPPDIDGPGGISISGDLATTLAGPRAPGQVAQAGEQVAQAAEAIGTITRIDGDVFVTRADGTRVRLQSGDEVYQGDVLETGDSGAVGITFVDKTEMSLGANGRMVLDEMIYDPEGGDGSSQFSLVSGVFSFVSGEIAKNGPDAMQVKTPVATIGIRGTKGVIKIQDVDTDGDGEADLRMEVALLDSGEIVVSTFQGSTQVINQVYTGFRVVQVSGRDVLMGAAQEEVQSFQVTRGYFEDSGVNTALRYLPSQNQNEIPSEQMQAPEDQVPQQLEPNMDPDAPTLDQDLSQQIIKVVLGSKEIREIIGLPPVPVGDPEPVAPGTGGAAEDGNVVMGNDGGNEAGEDAENTEDSDSNDSTLFDEIIEEVTVNGTFDATHASRSYRVFGGSSDDTVLLGSGDDIVYGGGGSDFIQTNDGDDTVYGGAGADTVVGGSGRGHDVYHGGDQNGVDDSVDDKLVYTSATRGVTVDLAQGYASGADIDYDTISGFEHVETAGGNDILKGNAAANRLQAGGGNDLLVGGQGDDTLQGGTGDDTYAYLSGDGSWGHDIIDDAGGGNDVLDLTQVPGHEPSAMYLDDADGDGAVDDLVLEYESGARQTVLNHLGSGRMERLRAVDEMSGQTEEYVIRDGTIGTSGNDILLGGSGADTFSWSAGDDVMFGNGGEDWFSIGGGSDSAFGGTEDDLYYLEASFTEASIEDKGGIDTLRVSNASLADTDYPGNYTGLIDASYWDNGAGDAGMRLTFSSGSVVEIWGFGIEDYETEDVNGTVVGMFNIHTVVEGATLSSDLLIGSAGDDYMVASDGDDIYAGGEGNDTLYASGGNAMDTLLGGAGNDDLFGADGDDHLDGGSGDDYLVGDAGADTLVGGDGHDHLDGGGDNDYLDGGAGNDTLLGGDGDDLIVYDSADGEIDGGAGTNTLKFSGSTVTIDAAALVNVSNFGILMLADDAAMTATLTLDGFDALVGSSGTLYVKGGDDDVLLSDDTWEYLYMTTEDVTYSVWTNGSRTLKVQNGVPLGLDVGVLNGPTWVGGVDANFETHGNWLDDSGNNVLPEGPDVNPHIQGASVVFGTSASAMEFGTICLTGDATLSVVGGNLTAEAITGDDPVGSGINYTGDVVVSGGTLTVQEADFDHFQLTGGTFTSANGIDVHVFDISGGTLNSGVWSSSDNNTITGSVTSNEYIVASGEGCRIDIHNADINGTGEITVFDGVLSITDSTVVQNSFGALVEEAPSEIEILAQYSDTSVTANESFDAARVSMAAESGRTATVTVNGPLGSIDSLSTSGDGTLALNIGAGAVLGIREMTVASDLTVSVNGQLAALGANWSVDGQLTLDGSGAVIMSGNSLVAGSGEVFFGADMTLGIGDGGGGSNVFDLGNFGIFDGVSQIRIDSLTELTITRDSIAAVTGDSVDKLYVQGSSNHTIRLADDPDSFDPFDPVSGTAGWSRDTAQDEVVGGISYQAYVNDTNNDVLMVAAGVNVTQ